ncbi:hypothetical protein L9F63_014078, partial [Diploptera punctata]
RCYNMLVTFVAKFYASEAGYEIIISSQFQIPPINIGIAGNVSRNVDKITANSYSIYLCYLDWYQNMRNYEMRPSIIRRVLLFNFFRSV